MVGLWRRRTETHTNPQTEQFHHQWNHRNHCLWNKVDFCSACWFHFTELIHQWNKIRTKDEEMCVYTLEQSRLCCRLKWFLFSEKILNLFVYPNHIYMLHKNMEKYFNNDPKLYCLTLRCTNYETLQLYNMTPGNLLLHTRLFLISENGNVMNLSENMFYGFFLLSLKQDFPKNLQS